MNSTRKNRPMTKMNGTHESKGIPEHASTMYGLNKWYVAEFEKLGWMVLAKEKGHYYKIVSYKKAIHHLLESIQHVMSEYTDPDRKHDLAVLHMHVLCLDSFVKKNL